MPKRNLLDEKDKKIINILRMDCLTPFVKIANIIGVNEGTIRHRIKRMIKHGIIKRFTVIIEPEKLGFATLSFVIVTVLPGKLKDVVNKLMDIQFISEIHEIHTNGDLLLKIRAPNSKEMANIISNNIKVIEGIKDTRVIYILHVWKEDILLADL